MTAWHQPPAAHGPDVASARPSAPWHAGAAGAARAAPRPDPGFFRGAVVGLLLILPFWSAVALGIWWLLR